jgi:hypothetical protein
VPTALLVLLLCPPGFAPDAARAVTLRGLLAGSDAGASVAAVPARVCFGARAEPALTLQGEALLPTDASPAVAAALLGHLLLHTRDGSPGEPRGGCHLHAARAAMAEARATHLEATLREAFGAPPSTRAVVGAAHYLRDCLNGAATGADGGAALP